MATNFWFKFYFKDWANDVKLLSLQARGLLTELIIYMNQNEPKGECENDLRLLCRLSGGLSDEVKASVDEFRKYSIFDFVVTTNGVETMVSRKIKKEEAIRLINSQNGKMGGNPTLKNKDEGLRDGLSGGLTEHTTETLTYNSISNSNNEIEIRKGGAGGKQQLMRNSPYFDLNHLIESIDEKYHIYDLAYYHESALNWSDSGNKKKANWLSTIRTWILRDIKENKPKLNKNDYRNQKVGRITVGAMQEFANRRSFSVDESGGT